MLNRTGMKFAVCQFLLLCIGAALLSGCQPKAARAPTQPPREAPTRAPSPTWVPTWTPRPTAPASTDTPAPAPSPTAAASLGPPMNRGVAFAYDAGQGELVAFGGIGVPGAQGVTYFNETWTYDGAAWSKHEPAHAPAARSAAVMAYDSDRQRVVLFGGTAPEPDSVNAASVQAFNDLWLWDGQDWTQAPAQNAPLPRFDAHMAYDAARQELVLFGGYGVQNGRGEYLYFDDTWTWDGETWTHHDVPGPGNGAIPPPSMTYDPVYTRQVLLWQHGSGLWTWDGAAWHNLPADEAGPSLFTSGQMVFDAATGRLVLRGEYPSETPRAIKTWTWDGQQWTLAEADTRMQNGYYQDAAMVYDTLRQVPLYVSTTGGKFEAQELRLLVWTGSTWQESAGYMPR